MVRHGLGRIFRHGPILLVHSRIRRDHHRGRAGEFGGRTELASVVGRREFGDSLPAMTIREERFGPEELRFSVPDRSDV
ncbi:hypothetical protein ACWZEH_35525 (plasmid) [Streptomyces sp. QTS137]